MTEIRMVTKLGHLTEIRGELVEASFVGLDVETTTDPWYTDDFKVLTIAVSTKEGHAWVFSCEHPHSDFDGTADFKSVLESMDVQPLWAMQGGTFDWLALQVKGVDLNLRWFDTQVAEYLITGTPQAKQSLVAIAKKYLHVPDWKDIDYSAPEEEDLQTLAQLNGRDADLTRRAALTMVSKLVETRQDHLYRDLLMPAVYALAETTQRGMPVDMDRLRELEETTADELENILGRLVDEADPYGPWPMNKNVKTNSFNPGSFKQVGKLLYDIHELPVPKFTGTGSPSTDDESLMKIEHLHPIVGLIREYRTVKKFHSSSLLPWLEQAVNGKLHPRFKPTQTRTGRLSSSDPNIQQVPPEGRTVFGGVPGFQVVEIDYSQLELRIVAELATEEYMLEAFHEDKDLHQVTADLLQVDRAKGKTANFGLLFGGGPKVLQREAKKAGIDLPLLEAEYIRQRWFEEYSQIAEYHERVLRQAHKDLGVYSLIGRHRPLPELASGDWAKRGGAERQAINMPVQSLASDITLFQFTHCANMTILGKRLWYPIATVHDSIVGLVPDEMIEDVPLIQAELEDLDQFNSTFGVDIEVPLKTDAKIGPYWR